MTLRATLVSLRAAIATATGENVYLRDDLPFDSVTGEFIPPTDARHVVLDLIPSAPTTGLAGTISEDLVVQVNAWSKTSLTDAIDLAEDARAAVEPSYARTGGVRFARDQEWRGVQFTITQVAAFSTFTT